MKTPLSNRPKITSKEIAAGSVTRYFVKHVSTGKVTEIDEVQNRYFSSHPYYQAISFQWAVGGNDKNITGRGGTTIYGTEHRNTEITRYYNQKMPGLNLLLKNPLEFFSGTVVKPPQIHIPSAPTPSPVYGGAVEAVTVDDTLSVTSLNRTQLGRLASLSSTAVTNISFDFVQGDWIGSTSTTFSGGGGSGQVLQVGRVGVGGAWAYLNTVSALSDVYIQMRWSAINNRFRFGAAARMTVSDLTLAAPASMIFNRIPDTTNVAVPNTQLTERGGTVNIQSASAAGQATMPTVFTLQVKGSAANTRISSPALSQSLTGIVTTTAGRVGVYANTDFGSGECSISDYYVSTDSILTVTGPAADTWRVHVLNASNAVIATSDAVSGTATVNFESLGINYPNPRTIRITDLSDTPLIPDETPTEGVWGGDAWTLT